MAVAGGEFPQEAFRHLATRLPPALDQTLATIRPLRAKNRAAFTQDFDALDLSAVDDTDRKALREAHTRLRRFANIHPGLGLHEVLTGDADDVEILKQVKERIEWVANVFELNPDVNFLDLSFLPGSADLDAVNFGPLSTDAREHVVADLEAHQRIYLVVGNPVPALELLQAGFHSASAIALTPPLELAEKTGLTAGEASACHAAAVEMGNAAELPVTQARVLDRHVRLP
jgi:hypothetical protein